MSENNDQNIGAFFDHVSEQFCLNFAVGNYVNKKIVEKYRLLSLFVPMALCLVTCTHSHTQRAQRGENPVTVANSEFQVRTN